MVALFGLLNHGLVGLKRLLGFEGGAVDTLQTSLRLVTAPVGGRRTRQSKSGNVLGGWNVRSTAQIKPLHLTGAWIDVVVVGQIPGTNLGGLIGIRVDIALVLNQLQLEGLVGEGCFGFLGGLVHAAFEALAALDNFLHTLLNRLEVLRGEGLSGLEVEVEAVLNSGADAELRAGELGLYGLSHDVTAGVADDSAAVLFAGGYGREFGVGLRGVGQVVEGAIGTTNNDDCFWALVGQVMLAHRRTHGSSGRDRNRLVVHRDCWNHFRHDLLRSFCAHAPLDIPGRAALIEKVTAA